MVLHLLYTSECNAVMLILSVSHLRDTNCCIGAWAVPATESRKTEREVWKVHSPLAPHPPPSLHRWDPLANRE